MSKKVLVIAPHPDDEVLGVGGTIAKFNDEGADVSVVIVTQAYPPEYDKEVAECDRIQALTAHQLLGVKQTIILCLPAARLDSIPHGDINRQLNEAIQSIQPEIMFIPFCGDIHLDHQRVFLSALVAARPNGGYTPKTIYAYETLSETNWNAPYLTPGFIPNVFFDISPYLEIKLKAMQKYASELQSFPHERSEETLRALATLRGSTVNRFAAEAFVLIREII